MFARSVLRATKVATPAQITRASLPKVARATFTASTQRRTPPEIIAEKEVAQSSYSGGEVSRSTIIVGEDAANHKVSPLTHSVYNTMPKTMQSLSLMGKTVIVTGYVRNFDLNKGNSNMNSQWCPWSWKLNCSCLH
jgi:hypothetical protein